MKNKYLCSRPRLVHKLEGVSLATDTVIRDAGANDGARLLANAQQQEHVRQQGSLKVERFMRAPITF